MDNHKEKPGAVIIGGSFHSLGAARNLTRYGVPVCVLNNGICVSQFSRHVIRFLKCPPFEEDERFIKFLKQIAPKFRMEGWVLFPSTDDSVRILSQNRESLCEHYHLTIPSWETIQFLYDKRLTYKLAIKQQVAVPQTYNLIDNNDINSVNFEYPLVLKPAVSKLFLAATKKKAYRVDNKEDLLRSYEEISRFIDPSEILIQEFIPGRAEKLYSYVGFFKNGYPFAGLSARRSRQHPMDFGRASTYVEVIHLPELEKLAAQLLTGIGFSGLAEVEFMYDINHNQFELLEVNPRIWGWHTIAIRAGLDLPYLAYTHALGQEIDIGSIREGVKWVRLATDIPTAISEILSGRLSIHQYLASMSGDIEDAVFSLNDPLPFIADLFLAPYNYLTNQGF